MPRTALGTNDFRGPAIGQPTLSANITYSGSLACDIWVPAVANRPAILLMHGGAWAATPHTRNNIVSYPRLARRLADYGFAVVNADFTSANDGNKDDPITDGKNLVQWVRDNAATYNIDSTRLAMLGISSGGHLALMVAAQGVAGTTRPDACVGWSPVTDLPDSWLVVQANIENYMDVTYTGNEALYESYSPAGTVSLTTCCPLRIVGSTSEETASPPGPAVSQFNDMETRAIAAGIPVTKRLFAGALHGFFDGVVSDGTNDIPGTCQWLARLFEGESVTLNRTVASGRAVATGRAVAA